MSLYFKEAIVTCRAVYFLSLFYFSTQAGSDKVVLILTPPWSKEVSLSLCFFNAERIREI